MFKSDDETILSEIVALAYKNSMQINTIEQNQKLNIYKMLKILYTNIMFGGYKEEQFSIKYL